MSEKPTEVKITTPEFRVSFPNLFEARAFGEGEPKYGLTMLFPKTADLSALRAEVEKVLAEKFPNKKDRPSKLRDPFLDGDAAEYAKYDGYPGHWFVRSTSKFAPGVVDRSLAVILDPDLKGEAREKVVKGLEQKQVKVSSEDIYAGCFARATVNFYYYDTKGNKGVGIGVRNVQKLRDGEKFSGRSDASEDFEALPDLPKGATNDIGDL